MTVPLTLIAGLSRDHTAGIAGSVLDLEPGTALVQHDLRGSGAGIVRRRIIYGPSTSNPGRRVEETTLELAHCCVSCTLREDVLPLIRELSLNPEVFSIVLDLDPALDPESVCWCLENIAVGAENKPASAYAHVDAVISVLDSSRWFEDAIADATLVERGLAAAPDDERTVAQVVTSQAEFADLIILAGAPAEPWIQVRTAAALDRLAPGVPRVQAPRDIAAISAA